MVPEYLSDLCAGMGYHFLQRVHGDSRKFSNNGIALLDKPAVAPIGESVITFENCYNSGNPESGGAMCV